MVNRLTVLFMINSQAGKKILHNEQTPMEMVLGPL